MFYEDISQQLPDTELLSLYMISGSNSVLHNDDRAYAISRNVNSKFHFAANAPAFGIPTPPTFVAKKGSLDGREAAEKFLPFSSFDSDEPEALWDWLAETSHTANTDFVAIPHNPNISGGRMFDEVDSEGRPITVEYARMRMRYSRKFERRRRTNAGKAATGR